VRLKKQSMRQMKDAALVERRDAERAAVTSIHEATLDPFKRPAPRYFRGALIKPK